MSRSPIPAPTPIAKRPRGRPTTPVAEWPPSLWSDWEEPGTFHEALALHMRRHGDTTWSLFRAVRQAGGLADRTTLGAWRRGVKSPGTPESLKVLQIIEARRLPDGYFREKRPYGRALLGHKIKKLGAAERRRLAWHPPDDFNGRTKSEQARILDWVRNNVLSAGPAYHRYP